MEFQVAVPKFLQAKSIPCGLPPMPFTPRMDGMAQNRITPLPLESEGAFFIRSCPNNQLFSIEMGTMLLSSDKIGGRFS